MDRVPSDLGFQLATGTNRSITGTRCGDRDPVVTRPLGAGLAVAVTALTADGRAEPVRLSRCRRWGLDPASALARAGAATTALAAERRLWRLGNGCWLTLLRAGPFTTGLVIDLAHRVPDGHGHGLLAAPDPRTLAVISSPRALDRARIDRAVALLGGLAGLGPGTIRGLIQFHPAGEFAIFGGDRNRPDHQLP